MANKYDRVSFVTGMVAQSAPYVQENYFNAQHNYVNMRLMYVNMQHEYM